MMRKIEREPNGLGKFVPGQDLVVAGAIAKKGTRAAADKKERCWKQDFPDYLCGIWMRHWMKN